MAWIFLLTSGMMETVPRVGHNSRHPNFLAGSAPRRAAGDVRLKARKAGSDYEKWQHTIGCGTNLCLISKIDVEALAGLELCRRRRLTERCADRHVPIGEAPAMGRSVHPAGEQGEAQRHGREKGDEAGHELPKAEYGLHLSLWICGRQGPRKLRAVGNALGKRADEIFERKV